MARCVVEAMTNRDNAPLDICILTHNRVFVKCFVLYREVLWCIVRYRAGVGLAGLAGLVHLLDVYCPVHPSALVSA